MSGFCNRREFVKGVVPACMATCLWSGESKLFAQSAAPQGSSSQGTAAAPAPAPATPPPHKFDLPSVRELTHRQRFRLEYDVHFIPYVKVLDRILGREKTIETLNEFCRVESEQYARYVVRAKGKNDLSIFKEDYSPSTQGMNEMLTMEVLEDTEKVWSIRVTECLWATTFIEARAAEYGWAAVCQGDRLFAQAVNPQIDLELTGTIMEGKPSCTLRYYVKG
jgi:hypothetical protein